MKPDITTLETEIAHIQTQITDSYNAYRDWADKLWNAERSLARAKRMET